MPNQHAPNAALCADAGAYAPAVARIFPRPHAPYFAAEPPRRRAAQLIAASTREEPARLREPLQFWSLRRLIAAYRPDAPDGLAEALRKLEGPAWNSMDYARLTQVLKEEGVGAKTLRHAQTVSRLGLAVLAALPDALRRPRIIANVPMHQAAHLVARAAKRAIDLGDAREVARLAGRLERARSPNNLFAMLIDEIGLEKLAPPPVPGNDWLKPLATVREIESAALRFENCLKGRIPWLLAGKGAYYEVVGARAGKLEPAIVEIVRDVAGLWVMGEVRGFANAAVSQRLMADISAHLSAHGARAPGAKPDVLALQLVDAAGW
jgi:hypothetical protein